MSQKTKMLLIGVAAICLTSCGGEDSPQSTGTAAVSPTPTPTSSHEDHVATPTPTPTSSIGVASVQDGIMQLSKVESGLDTESLIKTTNVIPTSAAPDVLGAFRFVCAPSHLAYDDPVVYPGQPGKSHLHQFFGNTKTDANSTYESLRKTGDSTCTSEVNRSAYWMPALLDGQGNAIVPNYVAIYYKRRPSKDPWFAENGTKPVILPRGLRYIFGNPTNSAAVRFKCIEGFALVGTGGSMTHALSQCSAGQKLMVTITSPDCWDGKNLDSEDHRSHVAYEERNGSHTFCPSTHPYAIARFTMTVEWSIEAEDTTALWSFSSDMGAEPGSTFHSDWFGAWEDDVMEEWHRGCIDEMLHCVDGDFGTGRRMKRNTLYPNGIANPRKVALNTIPK